MQALSLNQLVGQILGNYRIERFLGNGRLNAVYLGRHRASQRLDAVTIYLIPAHFSDDAHARFLARFHQESAKLIKLDNPHILPIYEYGEYVGAPYLVTPYVDQGSLTDLLKRYGRYDHPAILPVLEQLASGIAYAHSRGHIHGTLRPSNVVVRDQGLLQVAGFGLMHMLQLGGIEKSEEPYSHLLTVGHTFLVSPEYIAPEVVQGQAIDVRSDVYALGCILFELLCGQPPFTGSDPLEVTKQHVTQDLPSLRSLNPAVPVALVSVVNQALSRDPAKRFQYVEELKEAFNQASRGASSSSAQKGRSSSDEELHWSQQAQTSGRLQAIQPNGSQMSNTGKWQLLPPIVTGKLPALPRPSTPGGVAPSDLQWEQDQPAATTLPPIVPARLPVAPITDSPRLLPDVNGSHPASARPPYPLNVEEDLPPLIAPPSRSRSVPDIVGTGLTPVREATSQSLPGVYADGNKLAESYAWWSQHDETPPRRDLSEEMPPRRDSALRLSEEMPPRRDSALRPFAEGEKPLFYTREEQAPSAQSPQIPPTREPLVLPLADSWISEPGAPAPFGQSTKKRAKKKSRRAVVALLATGGVVAAGAAVALNFNRLDAFAGSALQSLMAHPNTQAPNTAHAHNTPQAHNTTSQPTPTMNTQATTGTVIGNTHQQANSAVEFTNPASGNPGLLVRLPDSTFAAYDQACTHVGVLVNYDPATKMLVCPAHGAIFDPAKGGAVVKGPAQLPLPKITIQVQANGNVTAV